MADTPPLMAGTCEMTQSMTNCMARVDSARYRPLTRSAAKANTTPTTAAVMPPSTTANSHGTPARVACTEA